MLPVNSKKQLNETSRKCKSLTAAQKKEICLKKAITPYIKQKELAIQYDISEGMISDILKERDRWLAIDLNSLQAGLRHEKKVAFPDIEEALTIWVYNAIRNNLTITDNILSTKALGFAFLFKEDKFKGSNG